MSRSGLFHGDGQPFDPDRFERELKEGIMGMATDHVESVVRDVVCPEHHQRATVTRTATGWEIRGCCQRLEKETRRAFGDSLSER